MRKTVMFLVVLATAACRHGALYDAEHLANPCPNGQDPARAIVCIDRSTLVPSTDPVRLTAGGDPSRVSNGNFFIANPQHGDVLSIDCPGAPVDVIPVSSDHVVVHVHPHSVTQKTTYKYTIDISGRKNDPGMEIDP